MIKEPTCFKNSEEPSCIDLILTNFPRCFQNSMAIETGLSDFHKMTITIMRSSYKKTRSKIISYRKYKTFHNTYFREDLLNELNKHNTEDVTI